MGDSRDTDSFDMANLRINLPHHNKRRGLSRYYSGKSQSFACMNMTDIRCVEDLKKKRKKYSDWQGTGSPSPSPSPSSVPSPYRRVSSSNQCSAMPYINV